MFRGVHSYSSHLHSEVVVLLGDLVIVLGAVADGAVHFEHAGVSGVKQRRQASAHHCPECFPVHSLTKVILLGHDARMLLLSKILIGQDVVLKEERTARHILFFPIYCFTLS